MNDLAEIMKRRILAHHRAAALGLLPRVRSKTLLRSEDGARIANEGPAVIEEISARYFDETGRDPAIELDYVPANIDAHGLSM